MNISSLTSFFKQKSSQRQTLDTILIKKLKSLTQETNLLVFKDINIYHHTSAYNIAIIVLDNLRGLYIFETKEWKFDDLKNADIQKAQNQKHSKDTLAYENTQNIIKQKFNELTHTDGIPIYNYLLMENLNADEYEHLNDSFKTLLPHKKVIFSDSNQADILKKLQDSSPERNDLQSIDEIMGTLFIQYTILDSSNSTHFCTDEQRTFIDTPLEPITYLKGLQSSGKSNLLLLKAIVEILQGNAEKIIILKPTTLACGILKQRLLNIIEHAIIEIDLSSIEIITPVELLNRHLIKLSKQYVTHIVIDPKLMKKSYNFADIIMCDDSDHLPAEFIHYLHFLQKKSTLILVSSPPKHENLKLNKNFRIQNTEVNFHKVNPHAKTLQLIAKYINNSSKNILIISNSISKEKLLEDLTSFVEEKALTIESSVALINQTFNRLLFCNYSDIYELDVNHIILIDLCFLSKNSIEYAFNLAQTSVDVVYEEECEEINQLRNRYEENSKE